MQLCNQKDQCLDVQKSNKKLDVEVYIRDFIVGVVVYVRDFIVEEEIGRFFGFFV